ncbi:uncharacterized protein PITG_14921 [Phytophthora infestans T30-4]|uniref:Uncharacterized protein n=1 Tax=Phytophthora infestans (strain T30-4) TaxID=403677 RepID=D0NPB7_PHYIT|nr:uncharacterized protein PITG_14921 [Phytophthora infestans T30-4]EEY62459.1 conserved hypothetical protein [Phytophthora infestans T30-4]|eukprot:XP_002899095.1 conserved hypothetical protein [Phytophthora infestans T30-4]
MARGVRIGSKLDVLKNLRSLLRVTRARGSQESIRECKFSQQILAQYRSRQHENDRAKMRAFRAEASDYLMLLQGVEEQRYLWALDAGVEKKLTGQEIVNASARRVGLEVPEMYAEKQAVRERKKTAKNLADKRAKEAAAGQ